MLMSDNHVGRRTRRLTLYTMHYFCVELDCVVEERPDGTIWRVELGPRRRVRYLDDRPIRNVGSAGACLIERNRFR